MALTPTISQQRRRWDAVPGRPAIRRREQWGASGTYTDDRAVTDPATRVFVHITVTNPANYLGNDAHAQAVERIGLNRFPATGISYNFGIMPNAALYEFQPVGRRGAHTVNDERRSTCTKHGSQCPGYRSSLTAPDWNLNYNARAFVFCAMESTTVTNAVVEKFALAIYTSYRTGFITKSAAQHIHGHRCVSAKSCPGDRLWARMKDIQARTNHLIEKGADVAITKDDVKRIWMTDGIIPAPRGYEGSDNKFWTASSVIRSTQYWARRGTLATEALARLVRAQQPLLEAAAQGKPLNTEQVQQIATEVATAMPQSLPNDVVDENE